MSNPTIIETDLREILGEINNKLETISKDVNQIQIKLATVETKLEGMDQRLEKVEGNQSKQIWALIGILFTYQFYSSLV